ncbi:hypothetical protein EKO04_006394 [Ascochyta lentis]|uniref:DOC domain-containing protein n=1 Tax=Ascochyta lentis TaxID=205686 RepID=A0A8H7J204_9PLEO|nr:hypothetical protein EKO04_006394 [Ascochyta lentis]
MLPSTRRRAQHHVPPPPAEFSGSDEDVDEEDMDPEEEDGDVMGDDMVAMEGEEDLEEEDGLASPGGPETPLPNLDPPPPYLREISTLASWTVSSSKPGCSIPQLRHPSPSLFWQSDGPQPHYLNVHFFKLVRIVGLRLYLDFEQDESYTPTRIIFLAGSGMNDLQEWGEMRLESPRGWVWADFSGVGDASDDDSVEEEDSEDDEAFQHRMLSDAPSQRHTHPPAPHAPSPITSQTPNAAPAPTATRAPRRPKMPVLRAHVVQIKILENHQNGKDTHLRGLQIFARNDEAGRSPVRGDGVGAGVGVGMAKEKRRVKEEVLELGGFGHGFDIR